MKNSRETVLKILAAKKGAFIAPASHDCQLVNAKGLKQVELIETLRELEGEGLVASIYERLDGPLFALTVAGREAMGANGCSFDPAQLDNTRRIFEEALCSKPM